MKTPSEEVTDMIFLNKWSNQTLCAGAELGVFDFLSQHAASTAGDVAEIIDSITPLLRRSRSTLS
jgi:hypothetical protein